MNFLINHMQAQGDAVAVARGKSTSDYATLLAGLSDWERQFAAAGIAAGQVVSIEGEYGTETISALLAAIKGRLIAVPLSADAAPQHDAFREIAQVQWRMKLTSSTPIVEPTGIQANHQLYGQLTKRNHSGLVLFTSGSTGESKAAVHDMSPLLEKFKASRQRLRTIVFLQLDHIGGVNTLLYTLANGGAVVIPESRSPSAVCRAIAEHRAELLPTSPTFLNLLLLSEANQHYDLSSLRLITYGTEPMPSSTLARLRVAFPDVKLQQTYGLTELGILRSKSRDSDSLWVRVGGEGYETRVVDGRLWVRAKSAMLGYLNAPSPFDDEGFFNTQDRVEVDGEWLRIQGRDSEIVNVGGNKVYPAEVESVLLEMDGVIDAAVCGEAHPLTGQVVTATVRLVTPEPPGTLRARMRQFCKDRLSTLR